MHQLQRAIEPELTGLLVEHSAGFVEPRHLGIQHPHGLQQVAVAVRDQAKKRRLAELAGDRLRLIGKGPLLVDSVTEFLV